MSNKLYKALIELSFELSIDVEGEDAKAAIETAKDIARDIGYDLEEDIHEDYKAVFSVHYLKVSEVETFRDKKRWVELLPSDVYARLGNCKTIKSDLPVLVDSKMKWMKADPKHSDYTKEDAIVFILELLDCNGQNFDLTPEEYDALLG